jgi:hypothetical protein
MPGQLKLGCEWLESREVLAADFLIVPIVPAELREAVFTAGPILVDYNRNGEVDLISRDFQGRVLFRPGLGNERFGIPEVIATHTHSLSLLNGNLFAHRVDGLWRLNPQGNDWLQAEWEGMAAGTDSMLISVSGPDWYATLNLHEQVLQLNMFDMQFMISVGPDANGLSASPQGLMVSTLLGDVWRVDLTENGPAHSRMMTHLPQRAVGDLNHDGQIDTVYRSALDQEVWVRLKNGETYSIPTQSKTGGVSLADLNNDGHLDLIVCDEVNNRVLIYLGLGNGRFREEANQGQGFAVTAPSYVTTTRLTEGPLLDLIVLSTAVDQVSIFLGQQTTNNDWTLTPGQQFQVGPRPTSVAAYPILNGQVSDLLITSSADNSLLLFPGQGGGTFNPLPTYQISVGSNPYRVLVSDFTGNGQLDAVTLNASSDSVSFIPNIREPFPVAQEIATGAKTPIEAVIRDVNGDGRSDLLVEHWHGNSLTVFRGDKLGMQTVSIPSPPSVQHLHDGTTSTSLWELEWVGLWPTSAESPALPGDPPGVEGPEGELLFQPLQGGLIPLVPLWSSTEAPLPLSTAAVLPITGTGSGTGLRGEGDEELSLAQVLPGSHASAEAEEEELVNATADEQAPLHRLLLGSDDTPAPEIAPDGATETMPDPDATLFLPMPKPVPVSRSVPTTPPPGPKRAPVEVVLEPATPSQPTAEQIHTRLYHTLGTAGLLVAIWLPRRKGWREKVFSKI